eukprot:m.126443 g.126443  ORF g.126443 m.126443 type:complete len:730 (-) comp9434_c1_seq38:1862-4051(-)
MFGTIRGRRRDWALFCGGGFVFCLGLSVIWTLFLMGFDNDLDSTQDIARIHHTASILYPQDNLNPTTVQSIATTVEEENQLKYVKDHFVSQGFVVRDKSDKKREWPIMEVDYLRDKHLSEWMQMELGMFIGENVGPPDLLVGILSARGNQSLRKIQRQTWLSTIKDLNKKFPKFRVEAKFIIGGEWCDIPVEDRLSQYDCKRSPLKNPVVEKDVYVHDIPFGLMGNFKKKRGVCFGQDFETHHPIIITQLGAFDSEGDGFTNDISIQLWDVHRNGLVASFTFSGTLNTLRGGARYHRIDPIVLSANARFSIVACGYDDDSDLMFWRTKHSVNGGKSQQHIRLHTGGGLISWKESLFREGTASHDGNGVVLPVNERYSTEEEEYAAGTFVFTAHSVTPSASMTIPWKKYAVYPKISLSTIDVLTLVIESDETVSSHRVLFEAETKEQFDNCDFSRKATLIEHQQQTDGRTGEVSFVLASLPEGHLFLMDSEYCSEGMKLQIEVTKPTNIVETVDALSRTRWDREKEYLAQMQHEEALLREEQTRFGDLLIVKQHMDTYRGLPKKLVWLYKYGYAAGARFVMKTDDDTFVNLPSIVQHLSKRKDEMDLWWWGSFRRDWRIDRGGKWAEHTLQGNTYPPFACGSGHVVSRGVVRWLSLASPELFCYQGEDVSLGVWLQAVNPTLIHDDRWQCFGIDISCDADLLSTPDNTPAILNTIWERYSTCRKLCEPCS